MKITENGTTIEVDSCAHCGKLPKKEWLRKELKWWSGLKCGVCGVGFKVVKLDVKHVKDRDSEGRISDRWVTGPVEREKWVQIDQEMPSGCDLNERFHEACLTKAFPFGDKAESEKQALEYSTKKAKK